MATHSSIVAWEIPWTEKPGGLQSRGLKESDTNIDTEHSHTHTMLYWKYHSVLGWKDTQKTLNHYPNQLMIKKLILYRENNISDISVAASFCELLFIFL